MAWKMAAHGWHSCCRLDGVAIASKTPWSLQGASNRHLRYGLELNHAGWKWLLTKGRMKALRASWALVKLMILVLISYPLTPQLRGSRCLIHTTGQVRDG